jgi:hypothetical protein
LEKHLVGIGSVQKIELDIPNKRASVILAMQGDPNPVKIQIERYSLAPSPAGSLLTIHDTPARHTNGSPSWQKNSVRPSKSLFPFPTPWLVRWCEKF